MKYVALKVEAKTKRIRCLIDLLDAEITEFMALEPEILEAGGDPDDVARGLDALGIIDRANGKALVGYKLLHGIVKEQTEKPDGPQPRTGT